jgi:hypothetical protein
VNGKFGDFDVIFTPWSSGITQVKGKETATEKGKEKGNEKGKDKEKENENVSFLDKLFF